MKEIRDWVYDEVTMELRLAQENGEDGWLCVEDLQEEMASKVWLAV